MTNEYDKLRALLLEDPIQLTIELCLRPSMCGCMQPFIADTDEDGATLSIGPESDCEVCSGLGIVFVEHEEEL